MSPPRASAARLAAFAISPAEKARAGSSLTRTKSVALEGWAPTASTYAVLPPKWLPVAMAPDGDRVIYMPAGSPASLWVATVHHGRLKHKRRLIADGGHFRLHLVAW